MCRFAWNLWSGCLKWWNLCWVHPNEAKACFESWMAASFKGKQKKSWVVVFFVIVWTIWSCINKATLDGAEVSMVDTLAQVNHFCKLRCRDWDIDFKI